MFYQTFLSPQVKRWVIITYKHGIYKFPHNLPNELTSQNDSPAPSLPAKLKILLMQAKNYWKTEIKLFP